jgi:hypothetical protein
VIRWRPRCTVLGMAILITIGQAGCSPPWQSGPHHTVGTIAFGFNWRQASSSDFEIVNSRDRFFLGQKVAWVAYLARKAGASKLELEIVSQKSHKTVASETVRGINPKYVQLANAVPVKFFKVIGVPIPGLYILEYRSAKRILAQGAFSLRR